MAGYANRLGRDRWFEFPIRSTRANAPAYDDIIQSASGVGDLFRRLGMAPMLFPTLIAGKVCGLSIAYAVLGALFHRERSDEGQQIEVPMLDTFRAFLLTEHGAAAIPQPPLAEAGYQRILTPERRSQATADGWINVLAYRAEDFEAIFRAAGRDELLGDARFATRRARIENADSLYRDLAQALATNTTGILARAVRAPRHRGDARRNAAGQSTNCRSPSIRTPAATV